MSRVALTCPTCGYSGAVDEAAVPTGPVSVTCPRCQGTFAFGKGTGVPPSGSGGAPPRRRKAPPPKRSRRKVLAVVAVAACVAAAAAAAWMSVFKLTPIVTEKLLIAALFSKVPPVQQVAIRALRDYPTKHTAVALVLFINLKNLQVVPDPKNPETPEQKARRLAVRARDLKLAERATETLCLLAGQSFGTYFTLERYGHSWGSLSEERWPRVLRQIDGWALQTLGGVPSPAFGLGTPGDLPQPTAVPEREGAR